MAKKPKNLEEKVENEEFLEEEEFTSEEEVEPLEEEDEAPAPEEKVSIEESPEEETKAEKMVKTQKISANQIKQLRESALALSKTVERISGSLEKLPAAITAALEAKPAPVKNESLQRLPLALSLIALFVSVLSMGLARSSRSYVMAKVEGLEKAPAPKEVVLAKPVVPSVPAVRKKVLEEAGQKAKPPRK